eukprot:1627633-Rhodomonas_salina.1
MCQHTANQSQETAFLVQIVLKTQFLVIDFGVFQTLCVKANAKDERGMRPKTEEARSRSDVGDRDSLWLKNARRSTLLSASAWL